MYWEWPYVLVQAGPDQALTWRGILPDLIFPLDRSWLFSMLWDDEWTCVGGPTTLIDSLASDLLINASPVRLREDPTSPGHVSIGRLVDRPKPGISDDWPGCSTGGGSITIQFGRGRLKIPVR